MSESAKMPVEMATALAAAQEAAQAVAKRGRNDQHNYRYATAEDVIQEAREALSGAKLALLPVSTAFIGVPGSLDDNAGSIGYLDIVYLLVHAPTGQTHEIKMQEHVCPTPSKNGGWARPLDKAIFAARTEGLGYLLRELLLIPRQDAPDISGRPDADERSPQRQPTQRGQRAQEQGRGGQAQPAQERAQKPAASPQNGARRLVVPAALAEAVELLGQRRAEAKGTPQELEADQAFAVEVERYAAAVTPDQFKELARLLTEIQPKGKADKDIRAAMAKARERLGLGLSPAPAKEAS